VFSDQFHAFELHIISTSFPFAAENIFLFHTKSQPLHKGQAEKSNEDGKD
jgi:hypothetical protein